MTVKANKLYSLPYLPASIQRDGLNYVSVYRVVVPAGATTLAGIVKDHLARCPADEHIALVGFSQGADVAARTWDIVASNGGMDRWRGRMDGLVLFGHPQFDPRQNDAIEAYSLAERNFSPAGHGIFGVSGVPTWSRSQESSHYLHSWCSKGDPVCNTTSASNIVSVAFGLQVHNGYPGGDTTSAGHGLSRWLVGHYRGLA